MPGGRAPLAVPPMSRMPELWRLSRRALLQVLAGLLGVDVARALDPRPDRREDMGAQGPGGSGSRASPAALTAPELDDLVAFAGILVVGARLGTDERRDIVEHVLYRVAPPSEYLGLYRDTLRYLEQLAGERFSTLGFPEQLDLVRRHGLAATEMRAADDSPLDRARRHRARVVSDLIAGYFGSPAGWATVGATAFPGRCGDLDRYTRPEA